MQVLLWLKEFTGLVVTAVAFLSALGWLWRRGKAMLRKIDKKLDELRTVAAFLAAEMTPNHGSSLRDAVDRLEKGQQGLETRMTALETASGITLNVNTHQP